MAKVIGLSGNSPVFGTMQTGEYLRKLEGQKGRAVFDEMRRGDGTCIAVLDAIALPILRADWFLEAASDSPQDVEIQETLSRAIFHSMTTPWRSVLRHAMLMSPFGFSALEKVYEYRDDLTLPRKLDPRLPQSVVRWKYNREKRELESIIQSDPGDGHEVELPIEKTLVFTNRREGENWEGISDLRPAYGSWWMKNALLKINGIKHERFGAGIPVGEAPENVKQGDDSWKAMVETLEDVAAQEQSYIMLPNAWKLSLLSGGGEKGGTDALPSIKYLDERIAVGMLAQFLNLGTTETGSRALGESFIDFFLQALQERAEYLAEVLNQFWIQELVNYNWMVDDYPTLKVGRIAPLALTALANLKSAGVLSYDIELENTVRRVLGIAELEEPEAAEPAPEPEEPRPEEIDEAPEEEEPEEAEPTEEEEGPPKARAPELQVAMSGQVVGEELIKALEDFAASGGTLRLENDSGHSRTLHARDLRPEEQLCDWPAIAAKLDRSLADATAEVLRVREIQIDKVALLLAGGKKVKDISVPAKKDQYDKLAATYKEMKKSGREDMTREILRQAPAARASIRAADPIEDAEYDDLIFEELDLAVNGAADKLKSIMAAIYIDLRKEGVTGDSLRTLLLQKTREKIGDRTWEDMGHLATNEGYGRGRDEGARDFSDQIDRSYRSGVLDTNICDACFSKDGKEHTWGDPEYMAPDPECDGGPRCRCVNIAVMKREQA